MHRIHASILSPLFLFILRIVYSPYYPLNFYSRQNLPYLIHDYIISLPTPNQQILRFSKFLIDKKSAGFSPTDFHNSVFYFILIPHFEVYLLKSLLPTNIPKEILRQTLLFHVARHFPMCNNHIPP